MSGYSHLTAEERDRLAGLMADGQSLRSIATALGRAASKSGLLDPFRFAVESTV